MEQVVQGLSFTQAIKDQQDPYLTAYFCKALPVVTGEPITAGEHRICSQELKFVPMEKPVFFCWDALNTNKCWKIMSMGVLPRIEFMLDFTLNPHVN